MKLGRKFLPFINLVLFVGVVIINILIGTRVIHGATTADISHSHPTKFTPASYTWTIWFLIWVALGVFVIYQLLPAYRENPLVLKKIHMLFALNMFGLIIWPFFWNFHLMWPAAIVSLFLLATLLAIYFRLGIDYGPKGQTRAVISHEEGVSRTITEFDFWILQVPFSLYLGWMWVVAIINLWVASEGSDYHHSGAWNYSGWSAFVQTILAIISFAMMAIRADFVFGAVIAWSLFGIAAGHHRDAVVSTAALVNGSLVTVAALMTAAYALYRYFTKERIGYTEIPTKP